MRTGVRALVRLLDAERAGVERHPPGLLSSLGARLQVSDAAVELGRQFFGPLLERLVAVERQPSEPAVDPITQEAPAIAGASRVVR
jgi:hypothetical protein